MLTTNSFDLRLYEDDDPDIWSGYNESMRLIDDQMVVFERIDSKEQSELDTHAEEIEKLQAKVASLNTVSVDYTGVSIDDSNEILVSETLNNIVDKINEVIGRLKHIGVFQADTPKGDVGEVS